MPAASYFSHFTLLYAPKPYKFLHLPRPSSAAAATVYSTRFFRLGSFAGWRWRNPHTTCSLAAGHFEFPSQFSLTRRKISFCTSDSYGKGKNCSFHRRADDKIRAEMGAKVNGKADATQCNESDSFPPLRNGAEKSPKLLTLPTILTIGRVAAVPLLVSTFFAEGWWGPAATTGIFILAAVTDWLDGYLARKMNLGTPFGAFLDPVADKLMVAATLILLCTRPVEVGIFGQVPWLFTVPAIAIIGREISAFNMRTQEISMIPLGLLITMSAVREWAASQDKKLLEAVAVNNLGKWKTATQMSALTILLAARDGSFVAAGTLVPSGVVLLYISAWLSLWSLTVYVKKMWKVLML